MPRLRLAPVLLPLAFASSAPASASTVEKCLLFLGQGDARLLLVTDGPLEDVETRSGPALRGEPASASLLLHGATLAPEIRAAWMEGPEGATLTVGQDGIRRIVARSDDQGASIRVESDQVRVVRTSAVGSRGLLVDLLEPGSETDRSLPEASALQAWMNGLSYGGPEATHAVHDRPRIAVDAGHGGMDQGAVGRRGTLEADVTLVIAERVAEILEHRLGAEVILIRHDDTFVALRDRAALANQADADLFVSIHMNASPSPELGGIETFYLAAASDPLAAAVARRENSAGDTTDSSESGKIFADLIFAGTHVLSQRLAKDVHESAVRRLTEVFGPAQIRDLGVKTAMFYVLVSARMPSILFEGSFLSRPDEEMLIRTPAFQRIEAEAIVDGVKTWIETSLTPTPGRPEPGR
jgi:N-acetylmuramoyl-L-alanine amidase